MILPKKGKILREVPGRRGRPMSYPEMVSSALRSDVGDTHRAIKTVMRWTGASERAVKNWITGVSGPNGQHLLHILRRSDVMLQMVLAASRRLDLLDLALAANGESDNGKEVQSDAATRRVHAERGDRTSRNVPDHDPIRGPDDDPDGFGARLNRRQQWFVAGIAGGQRWLARSIQSRFEVSERTAKRDIAAVKDSGQLQFIGTRRRGRYVLPSKT